MKPTRVKIGLLIIVLLILGAAFFIVPRKRSFSTYASRAETAFKNKNFNQSIELYLKSLKQYPKHIRTPEVLLIVGDIYNFSLGNTEKAGKAYGLLNEKYPRSFESRRGFKNAAEMYEKNQQYQKSLLAYQGILDNFPGSSDLDEVRFSVANMALKLKKYEPARRSLMAIIENNPETPIADRVLYQIGNIFFMEGASQAAIQVLEVTVKKYPDSPLNTEMLFTLGNAYEERGQVDKSLKIYRSIQALYPNPMVIDKKIQNLVGRKTETKKIKSKKEAAKKDSKTPGASSKQRVKIGNKNAKSLNDADKALRP